jgi:hypothetical protein
METVKSRDSGGSWRRIVRNRIEERSFLGKPFIKGNQVHISFTNL